jgi:hypothetical protein
MIASAVRAVPSGIRRYPGYPSGLACKQARSVPYWSVSTYVVVPDGAMFAVRLGDASGPVIATFSNKLAAETFAERQRAKDQDTPKAPPDEDRRA